MTDLYGSKLREAIRVLKDKLGVDDFEAEELLKAASVLADGLEELARSYDIGYIEETKTFLDEVRLRDNKDTLGKLMSSKPNLSYQLREMWRQFSKADELVQNFNQVVRINQLGNSAPNLTAALETMHESRVLSQPTRIANGRRIYEILSKQRSLAKKISTYIT